MQLSRLLLRNRLDGAGAPFDPHEYLQLESSVQGLLFLTRYLLALYVQMMSNMLQFRDKYLQLHLVLHDWS